MRLMTGGRLRELVQQHPRCAQALANWSAIVRAGRWTSPAQLQDAYGKNVRPLNDERVVFNILGNDFRLIAAVRWATDAYDGIVYIKFFGTHADYDRVDALTVDQSR